MCVFKRDLDLLYKQGGNVYLSPVLTTFFFFTFQYWRVLPLLAVAEGKSQVTCKLQFKLCFLLNILPPILWEKCGSVKKNKPQIIYTKLSPIWENEVLPKCCGWKMVGLTTCPLTGHIYTRPNQANFHLSVFTF